MELHEQLEHVTDQDSFLAFVRALLQDRISAHGIEAEIPARSYGADAPGWENASIEDFLGAALSWAEDSNFGAAQGLVTANLWRKFAVFLYCGKVYE